MCIRDRAPGAPALKELQREFGDTILDDYGNLRRHTLANLAFSSLEKTKRLNAILLRRASLLAKKKTKNK